MSYLKVVLIVVVSIHQSLAYLQVDGKSLKWNGQKVYLSGPNMAWKDYDQDWGNGKYWNNKNAMNTWLDAVKNNGGNAIRVWVHFEGGNSPAFDSNGYVTGTDRGNNGQGSLISELGAFLDEAASRNVFVILTLWNGAAYDDGKNQNLKNLIYDDSKLQSYIDKALKPMVSALSSKKALAAWEIINEPEGIFAQWGNPEPCYDGSKMAGTGAGFKFQMDIQRLLRFVNWQADAIHSVNGQALVTVGSWSEHAQNTNPGDKSFNYYQDSCLMKAGGRSKGKLDFYQMHTYAWQGKYNTNSPAKVAASSFNLDKPLLVGEYAAICSDSKDIKALSQHFYNSGYVGALTWEYNDHVDECTDSRDVQNQAMWAVNYQNDDSKGGHVKVQIN